MPRFGGRGFGGGGRGLGGSARTVRQPPPVQRPSSQTRDFRTAPQQKFSAPPGGPKRFSAPAGYHGAGKGPGLGAIIGGSFLGSALGSVMGNAISHKMYEGRNPETGAWEDKTRPDNNPCKRELDYFLECAKFVEEPSYCKGPADALKKCAEKHKDYFQESEG
ncbi:unnamed protein product [Candidula unifasciata]|uniref:CHCH domain-containing protein n=1 Tax=Candidula unifasciata TaxID=100452 RepID=A0A8S4A7X8_9EUPU|nr:unnamed protein product [Candidula unifasciata]